MEVGAARIMRSTKLCYMFFDVGKVLEHCVPLPRQLMQCYNLTLDARSVLPGFLESELEIIESCLDSSYRHLRWLATSPSVPRAPVGNPSECTLQSEYRRRN